MPATGNSVGRSDSAAVAAVPAWASPAARSAATVRVIPVNPPSRLWLDAVVTPSTPTARSAGRICGGTWNTG